MDNKSENTRSALYKDVLHILQAARQKVYTAINSQMVQAYWLMGKRIVEEEQQGEQKASYGEALLKNLSIALTQELGKGFTYANLRNSGSSILPIRTQRIATHCVAN